LDIAEFITDAYSQRAIRSIESDLVRQRQGIKGKPDASKLPSFAGDYPQLDPGKRREEGAAHAGDSIWDKHFVATRSSNVQEVFYDSGGQILRTVFLPRKNQPAVQYLYYKVPQQVFNRLHYMQKSGGSVGAEFWKLMRIKPHAHRYDYRKLVGGELGGSDSDEIQTIYGVYHAAGAPSAFEAPYYAPHTKRAMREAYGKRLKRSQARSARSSAETGGSARSRKRR